MSMFFTFSDWFFKPFVFYYQHALKFFKPWNFATVSRCNDKLYDGCSAAYALYLFRLLSFQLISHCYIYILLTVQFFTSLPFRALWATNAFHLMAYWPIDLSKSLLWTVWKQSIFIVSRQHHNYRNIRVFYVMGCLIAILKTMFSNPWYSRYYCILSVIKTSLQSKVLMAWLVFV
jgi:hypothetical protein